MKRTIFNDGFLPYSHYSPDVSPITPSDNTPYGTSSRESNAANLTRMVPTSVIPTPYPVDEASIPEKKEEDNDYVQMTAAGPRNDTSFIIQSTDHLEDEENCTSQEFSNAKFVRVDVIEGLDAIEKDQSPNERSRLRIFRASPTQSFPKITTDRSEAVVKLSKEQRRENYFRNMSNWVVSSKKDGIDFDAGDTIEDFDYVERVEQARHKIHTKMIRDKFGVWRMKSEVDEGDETVTNAHPLWC